MRSGLLRRHERLSRALTYIALKLVWYNRKITHFCLVSGFIIIIIIIIIIVIIIIIITIMTLQPFVGPWPFFSILILYTVGRIPWTGD
jgi:hypothetical protein